MEPIYFLFGVVVGAVVVMLVMTQFEDRPLPRPSAIRRRISRD